MTRWLGAALLSMGIAVGAVRAQDFPSKPVKIVVPFTPGSPVDAVARVAAQYLQIRIGQSVVIENRPGAGTSIGARAAASAEPDGHTLLFIGTHVAFYSVLYPTLDFDLFKRLQPVATVAGWSNVMVVAADVPARTISEIVGYAKANPGKLVFGYGHGTIPHILGSTFKEAAGVDFTFLPYRGGEQARMDLLGGRVQINFAPVSNLLPLIESGKVHALAVTHTRRDSRLPEVPTMRESGLPQVGFDPDTWVGLLAPFGTPGATIEKLNREINESLRSDAMREALARLDVEPMVMSAKEYTAFLAIEMQKWPPRLRAAGLKAG